MNEELNWQTMFGGGRRERRAPFSKAAAKAAETSSQVTVVFQFLCGTNASPNR